MVLVLKKWKYSKWSHEKWGRKKIQVPLCYVLVFSLLEMAVIFNAVDFEHV